jgi:hypothetical protein
VTNELIPAGKDECRMSDAIILLSQRVAVLERLICVLLDWKNVSDNLIPLSRRIDEAKEN